MIDDQQIRCHSFSKLATHNALIGVTVTNQPHAPLSAVAWDLLLL